MQPGVIVFAANFQNTINLGAVIVIIVVVTFYGLATFRDRGIKRWREMYELADVERKEIQGELNEAREVISDLKEQVAKLEALQMPIQVVNSLHETAEAASDRQIQILQHFDQHEKLAEKRSKATLDLLQLIADRIGPNPNGHPAS